MSPAIWLIAEDATDFEVIKQIFANKYPSVILRFRNLSGGSGGISRLAQQLPGLINVIRQDKKWHTGDCIAVIHDLDAQAFNKNQAQYDAIARICDTQDAIHLVPDDKIEAWLLSDDGLCAFLEVTAKNWDTRPDVKDELESLLRQKKMVYQGRDRQKLIEKVTGTGHKKSLSMRQSLKNLVDAGCIPA